MRCCCCSFFTDLWPPLCHAVGSSTLMSCHSAVHHCCCCCWLTCSCKLPKHTSTSLCMHGCVASSALLKLAGEIHVCIQLRCACKWVDCRLGIKEPSSIIGCLGALLTPTGKHTQQTGLTQRSVWQSV